MYTADHFLSAIRQETRILGHLHSKLADEQLDYRPAEGMRSTLELLRYLSYCGIAMAEALIEGEWDKYRARAAAAEDLSTDDFPQAISRQQTELETLIGGLSAEDFDREVDLPSGGTATLGAALVHHCSRYLATYRMQLFIYAKASGCSELSTSNNWGGFDPPKSS